MKAPKAFESVTLRPARFKRSIDIIGSDGFFVSIVGKRRHYAPLFAGSLRTANALASLLECLELDLDDIEEDTRRAIEEAREALTESGFGYDNAHSEVREFCSSSPK